jgi:colanic acid/amylovoran biosynthesis glycosyltransferase
MAIAYLINRYPKFSETFIRREILALEAQGMAIARYSIRSGEGVIVDPADREELTKTQVVLGVGLLGLLFYSLRVLGSSPIAFLQGLGLALKTGWRSDRGVLYHLAYLAEACVLRQWFQRDGIDHVHAHFGTNSTAVAMLCHAIGGPTYSFTVHGPEEFDRLVGLSLDEKIHRAAFVVGISAFGRSQLYRWCRHDQWGKIHIVHCGLDAQFLQQPITPIPTAPNLVCVGRLCEQKGQLLLLQAVHQLHQAGMDFHLTLVGDGELRSEIEALIETNGLCNKVTITGLATMDEVQKCILNARVFVLPSFGEGLPVAIMEALALGRPVISTYIAGIPELIKPGETGWLVPAGSVDELAQTIAQVLRSPLESLEAIGQRGAEAVARSHDIQIEAAKLKALLEAQSIDLSDRISPMPRSADSLISPIS